MVETERKFLVKEMPDLTGIEVEEQERYFLGLGNNEKRITRVDNRYFLESKTKGNSLSANKESWEISKDEFEKLGLKSIGKIVRKNYVLSGKVSVKLYEGDYKSLVRTEFEFESEIEAKKFRPPDWVGPEITGTDLGRDGKLIKLSRNKFLDLLNKFIF